MIKFLKIIHLLLSVGGYALTAYLVWHGASAWWFLMAFLADSAIAKLLNIIMDMDYQRGKGPLNRIETK